MRYAVKIHNYFAINCCDLKNGICFCPEDETADILLSAEEVKSYTAVIFSVRHDYVFVRELL
jgi:hypothetical protein